MIRKILQYSELDALKLQKYLRITGTLVFTPSITDISTNKYHSMCPLAVTTSDEGLRSTDSANQSTGESSDMLIQISSSLNDRYCMLHGYNNSSISEPDTVWDIFEMLHDP
jgi:hypothetical protein